MTFQRIDLLYHYISLHHYIIHEHDGLKPYHTYGAFTHWTKVSGQNLRLQTAHPASGPAVWSNVHPIFWVPDSYPPEIHHPIPKSSVLSLVGHSRKATFGSNPQRRLNSYVFHTVYKYHVIKPSIGWWSTPPHPLHLHLDLCVMISCTQGAQLRQPTPRCHGLGNVDLMGKYHMKLEKGTWNLE